MNFNANTIEEARIYLQQRYNQILSISLYPVLEFIFEDKAIITNYNNGYSSIYLLNDCRGSNLYSKIVNKYNLKIMTMEECNIVDYLKNKNIDYIVVKPSFAYLLISKYYGNQIAKRSQVPLINHINEGLTILVELEVDQEVLDAYCLHPILQSDESFNKNYNMDFTGISTSSLLLAMEYRRVANSYLSIDKIEDFVGFTNDKIRQMLYADKIQNEKDFALYHEDIHPRSKELRKYFNNWINILLK